MNLSISLLRGIAERNRAHNPQYAERLDHEIDQISHFWLQQHEKLPLPQFWVNPDNLLVIADRTKWGNASKTNYVKFNVPCLTWQDVLDYRSSHG